MTMSDYRLKFNILDGLLGTNCPNDTNSRLKFNILSQKKKKKNCICKVENDLFPFKRTRTPKKRKSEKKRKKKKEKKKSRHVELFQNCYKKQS